MTPASSSGHRLEGVARVSTWRFAGLAASAAVFGLCAAVAADGTVPGWEADVFHRLNDLPDPLEPAMWVAQLAGLLLVPIVLAAVAVAVRRVRVAVALAALVPAKLLVEHGIVKQLVERERPGTTVCDGDTTCGEFRGDVPLDGLSFVSGHAIVAWGVATLLWPYLSPAWRWVAIGVAAANAVARVYLGAHNPLDVVGGAAVGATLGVGLTMIVGAPTVLIPPPARM